MKLRIRSSDGVVFVADSSKLADWSFFTCAMTELWKESEVTLAHDSSAVAAFLSLVAGNRTKYKKIATLVDYLGPINDNWLTGVILSPHEDLELYRQVGRVLVSQGHSATRQFVGDPYKDEILILGIQHSVQDNKKLALIRACEETCDNVYAAYYRVMYEFSRGVAAHEDVRVVLTAAHEATQSSEGTYSRYSLCNGTLYSFIWLYGYPSPALNKLKLTGKLYSKLKCSMARLSWRGELYYEH